MAQSLKDCAVLLVDGDEYLFKATSVCEREVQWDEENHVLSSNEREAWDNFRRMVGQLKDQFNTKRVVLCFSGKRPYFREHLLDSYKSGRPARKPLCYKTLREWCDAEYTVKVMPGLEADDVMGILATKPDVSHTIICSQDKDMLTVPGFLLRDKEVVCVTAEDAKRAHFLQTLIGDKTDGYFGCPGMGPKRAESHLSADDSSGHHPWSWGRVVEAYGARDLGADYALTQARVAKILTWEWWDSSIKEPILWQPR